MTTKKLRIILLLSITIFKSIYPMEAIKNFLTHPVVMSIGIMGLSILVGRNFGIDENQKEILTIIKNNDKPEEAIKAIITHCSKT